MHPRVALAAGLAFGLAAPATASDLGLPKTITLTAYGTTSSGYAQSIAIGAMLKKKHDTELRVIPGKNDVSRMIPVKKKRAQLCACGISSYFNQEGVFMFGSKEWGPMAMRNLYNNTKGPHGLMPVFAGDAGIKGHRTSGQEDGVHHRCAGPERQPRGGDGLRRGDLG